MMMYLPLLIGALLCFAVLGTRYLAEANNPKRKPPPASWTNRIRLAKLLVGAAMALYAISTTLDGLGEKIVVP
jgi:hypothetical protein